MFLSKKYMNKYYETHLKMGLVLNEKGFLEKKKSFVKKIIGVKNDK